VGRCGLDASGPGEGPLEGHCEHGNELSGSIKSGKFLGQVSDSKFFAKDSSQWS
jgi:hypothetical protein